MFCFTEIFSDFYILLIYIFKSLFWNLVRVHPVDVFFEHLRPSTTNNYSFPKRKYYLYIITIYLTNQLTIRITILLEKLIIAQLVKYFPAFNGHRRFVTVFTTAYLCHMNQSGKFTSHFVNINFIPPPMSRSSKEVSLSL